MPDHPQPTARAPRAPLAELPQRLHHHAFATRDQEVNRQFMEDVLGIPLTATWCERVFRPEVGREVEYCHTFYEMADGGALAFFQFADPECHALNSAILHPSGAGSWHISFKVSEPSFHEIVGRLDAAGTEYRRIDHGYCLSLYVRTPDGLKLEFTVDAPDAAEIAAMRRKDAHSELARWLGGDRRPNNDDRPH